MRLFNFSNVLPYLTLYTQNNIIYNHVFPVQNRHYYDKLYINSHKYIIKEGL